MKKIKITGYFLIAIVFACLTACTKDMSTPYDNPFFYIHQNNIDSVRIPANRSQTVDYKVYLSSKRQFEPITLNYAIIVGDGLKENQDYELITKGSTLVFTPGSMERSITIRWISNPLDASKNNTLTIKLLDNNKNITVGLPGPDKKQSSFKIIKY